MLGKAANNLALRRIHLDMATAQQNRSSQHSKHAIPYACQTGALQSVANFNFSASDAAENVWERSQAPPYPAGAKHNDPTADHPEQRRPLIKVSGGHLR